MELSFGRDLFARYADHATAMVALLEAAVAEMHRRAADFGGITRTFTVSVAHPFLVVMIDELAFLTAYQPERDLRKRAEAAIATLTSQGRSVGVCVVGALQDPRKDVINLRNLFPTRIAMRLDESDQVDMVLGDGARDRGALADQISPSPRSAPVSPTCGWRPPPTRSGPAPGTSPTPTSAPWPRSSARTRAVRRHERRSPGAPTNPARCCGTGLFLLEGLDSLSAECRLCGFSHPARPRRPGRR